MLHKVDVSLDVAAAIKSTLNYLDNVLYEPNAGESLLEAYATFQETVEKYPEFYPLCDNPELMVHGYRKALLNNYVLLYKYENEVVYVSHFFHQSQNYAKYV